MNKERYWKVFLKTHDRYRGLFYKKKYDYNRYCIVKEIALGDITIKKDSNHTFWKMEGATFLVRNKVNMIQLSFENEFRECDKSRILLSIDDDLKNNSLWHRPFLILFAEDGFDKLHRGYFNYELPPIKKPEKQNLTFLVYAGSDDVKLENVKIRFLSPL